MHGWDSGWVDEAEVVELGIEKNADGIGRGSVFE